MKSIVIALASLVALTTAAPSIASARGSYRQQHFYGGGHHHHHSGILHKLLK